MARDFFWRYPDFGPDRSPEKWTARLPERAPRPRFVELNAEIDAAASDCADDYDLQETSRRANDVIGATIAALPVKDRMLLRLHFVRKMSLADVARILQVPQRPLYRRMEQILRMLRDALLGAGIDAGSAAELIGTAAAALHFRLSSGEFEVPRQTNGKEQA